MHKLRDHLQTKQFRDKHGQCIQEDIRYVKVKLENLQYYINLGMDYSSRLTASLSMEHFESKPPSLVQANHHLILQFLLTPVRLKDSSIIFAQTLNLPELQEERNIPHRDPWKPIPTIKTKYPPVENRFN